MDVGQVGQFLAGGLRARTLLRCAADANDLRLVWVTGRQVRVQHQHLVGSRLWKSVLGVDGVHRGRPGRRRSP